MGACRSDPYIHTYIHWTICGLKFRHEVTKKNAPLPFGSQGFTSYILTKEMKRSVGMESHCLYPIALKKKSSRRKWPTAEGGSPGQVQILGMPKGLTWVKVQVLDVGARVRENRPENF